jgi:5'-methylthioinosine phosphorylase
MAKLAIIGGTGLTTLDGLQIIRREMVNTPYGPPSGALLHGEFCGKQLVFLARHGYGHTIPPHKVNYRANLWALKSVGIERVIAGAAVGGIRNDLPPGVIAFPDQIIDYTWSREQTYFDEDLAHVTHIDFTKPYCEELRQQLMAAAAQAKLGFVAHGTYGATQGPRLETIAEIHRLEHDGCAMVGMTGMPEAALARELDLCYATCAMVANWAAGRGEDIITIEAIETNLKDGRAKFRALLKVFLPTI